eukprot:7621128-Pyramimonas_sp.AAC.1
MKLSRASFRCKYEGGQGAGPIGWVGGIPLAPARYLFQDLINVRLEYKLYWAMRREGSAQILRNRLEGLGQDAADPEVRIPDHVGYAGIEISSDYDWQARGVYVLTQLAEDA